MQRSWSAIVFSAVGMFAIVNGIDYLSHLKSGISFWSEVEPSWWMHALGYFSIFLLPVILLILGVRLFFWPPGKNLTDTPNTSIGEPGPALVVAIGFMVTGIILIGTSGARLATLLMGWFMNQLVPKGPPVTAANFAPQILAALLGIYLVFGAPHFRRWVLRRIDKSTPSGAEGLPERYLAAALTIIGAMLATGVVDSVVNWIITMVDTREIALGLKWGLGIIVRFLLGIYLLTGAKAIRSFQLGLLDKQKDKPAEESVE